MTAISNQTLVSLDLETTGLDPENDHIIEIGAVKFRGREVLDTFHTLINPSCPLPYRVRIITGIVPGELQNAPPFSQVAEDLLAFVGDSVVVGQNLDFDLSFLRSHGLPLPNAFHDIFELAIILFPRLSDYSLLALAQHLGIACPVSHRALEDALTAREVFLAMLDKAAGLDLPLVAEVNRLSIGSAWSWRSLFLEIERAKLGGVSLWDREVWEAELSPLSVQMEEKKPLVPKSTLQPVDRKWLAGLLAGDGPLSRAFPAFEYRHGQVTMLQEVAGALNHRQHLIVEAGTGIGKSVAYLLPALFFALQNDVPVVISTNTINLQEQLMNKDIPDLRRALDGLADGLVSNLEVAQLKGRNNYLCIRRWNAWRQTPDLPWAEAQFLLRLLLWLASTSSGDRAELNLTGAESYLWNRVCASEDNCVTERCPYYPSGCFLHRARHGAEGAHLVVVNHALLLSDLATQGGILPDYRYLIVDEAHHLEEEATEQLGYDVGQSEVGECLESLGDRGSLLFRLRTYLRAAAVAYSRRREIEQEVEHLREIAEDARDGAARVFDGLAHFVSLVVGEQGEYERHLRLTREPRHHSGWPEVELAWENLKLKLDSIEARLGELYAMMEDLPSRSSHDLSDVLAEVSSLRQNVQGLCSRIDAVIASPQVDNIYWVSLKGDGSLYLHAAPLHVGLLLQKSLFSQKDAVVLTSATLSTGGSFEYIRESLGLEKAEELAVDAPFDYISSTLIYLPQDIPEPDKAGYQDAVRHSLVEVCRAAEGRTLALFTSHASLRSAYGVVQPLLEEEGIMVLGQGIDGSPRRVVNRFKANSNSVLLGTSALWEGIDVVGRALSVLVIVRLPFSVPTDPVFSARSELYNDPFNQYLVPQAVLKFKQGFGRLIRSRQDRGVVIILDRRLQTKLYGSVFLASLPKCTMKSGSLRQMSQAVLGWLGD